MKKFCRILQQSFYKNIKRKYVSQKDKEAYFSLIETEKEKASNFYKKVLLKDYPSDDIDVHVFHFIEKFIFEGEKESRPYFEKVVNDLKEKEFLEYGIYSHLSKYYLLSTRFLLEALKSKDLETYQKSFYFLAINYKELGRFDIAESYFDEIIKSFPNEYPGAYYYKGAILNKKKNYKEAQVNLSIAVNNFNIPSAYIQLAHSEFHLANYEETIKILQIYIKEAPPEHVHRKKAMFYLGLSYMKQNKNLEEAINIFYSIRDVVEFQELVDTGIVSCLYHLKNYEECLHFIEKCSFRNDTINNYKSLIEKSLKSL
jgi:tetratricopeptide (TPR) repeat protein